MRATWADSGGASDFRRNFRPRAGRLVEQILDVVMRVPSGVPCIHRRQRQGTPPLTLTFRARLCAAARVRSVKCEVPRQSTAAPLPRNPERRDRQARSSRSPILLVACRSSDSRASSGAMRLAIVLDPDEPLCRRTPVVMVMRRAPASRLFDQPLTTERLLTTAAAIRPPVAARRGECNSGLSIG